MQKHVSDKTRCAWVRHDPLSEHYHDHEWGVRVHDDRRLFEFLILESAQAGLSWDIILKRRTAYRRAFAGFNPEKVARFSRHDIEQLMKDEGIIRNRLKIETAISNARLFLAVQKEFGSFAHYLSQFVAHRPVNKKRRTSADIPTITAEAERLSRDLKRRGFKFFGPVIAYAYMQAVGLVNDHVMNCFRYREILEMDKKKSD